MKKILTIIFISVFVSSCQPDEIPPIGERTDYKPMLSGTWGLVKFEQIDADAEAKSFPAFATSKDLTNVFTGHSYSDFSITFKADGTFTSSKGNSYVQVMPSGNWALDSSTYPSAIILTNGGTTQTIRLASLADLVIGKMQFKEERKQADGKVKIKYIYSLTKK